MNVIDSNILERDAGGKPLHTFPHPALVPRSARRWPIRDRFDTAISPGDPSADQIQVSLFPIIIATNSQL
jgi:hypothetical protein